MNAIKKIYEKTPGTIKVPDELVNKRTEVIFIVEDEVSKGNEKTLADFYGSIPDFPERGDQGEYEKREEF